MEIKRAVVNFWEYLKKDTWGSWLVSLILIFLLIKFIFFPLLSLATGTSLPLVVVESCSMYHGENFDDWWNENGGWYRDVGISKEEFLSYSFKNGLNKGDIILTWGYSGYKRGDILIFSAPTKYPLIHRLISDVKISTKGDNNQGQLNVEKEISEDAIIGKSIAKIPFIGWLKLIFFEFSKPEDQRGLCS